MLTGGIFHVEHLPPKQMLPFAAGDKPLSLHFRILYPAKQTGSLFYHWMFTDCIWE